MAVVATAVVAATGVGWQGYHDLAGGITTSQALIGAPVSTGDDQNILIMGLDSRLDQHGNPLPQEMYDALHAGDETVGGYNANVLIVLHIPGGDGPITAVSIPRDDYVTLPGCPSGECQGKVKQAYGLAYQQAMDDMANRTSGTGSGQGSGTGSGAGAGAGSDATGPESTADEQAAREAGRKAQIATVHHLLDVPIDHFIEVTLGAFFQIAAVVQPITVCLNADTRDDFSGADFHRGVQQIDAAQAMAFVRQRRDVNDALFTDLDRTRRQQAFIVSLVSAMRDGGALSSPAALRNLADVAKQNVAVDAGLNLVHFVDQASSFAGRKMSLYTLPIGEFGQDPLGQDVNIIDVPTIRAIVHDLFTTGTATSSTAPAPPPPSAEPAIVDVVNATTHAGLATSVSDDLAKHGFIRGEVSTGQILAEATTIQYGPGAEHAATAVADRLDLPVTAAASETIPVNTVQVTLGADFPAADFPADGATTSPRAPVETPAPVDATAAGANAPAPTDLTAMSAAGIPCVR